MIRTVCNFDIRMLAPKVNVVLREIELEFEFDPWLYMNRMNFYIISSVFHANYVISCSLWKNDGIISINSFMIINYYASINEDKVISKPLLSSADWLST